MKRIKKPAVRPELRREWFRRHEEEGESPPEIAMKDKYDVRTVRKQLEIERQERERREARSMVLREAMEKHYADLCTFAQKLDSHVFGESGSLTLLRSEPMWSALREHMPRSVLWRNMNSWETLLEEIQLVESKLRERLEILVMDRSPLEFSTGREEPGMSEGIVDLLVAHSKLMARGETGLDGRTDFRLNVSDNGTTSIGYGAYTVGRVPSEKAGEVKKFVLELISEVTTLEEYGDSRSLFNRLEQVKRELHDELLIIILRRIVPGRCRYCPL